MSSERSSPSSPDAPIWNLRSDLRVRAIVSNQAAASPGGDHEVLLLTIALRITVSLRMQSDR